MGTPFSIAAAFNLPGDNGLPPDPIPFQGNGSFTSLAEAVLTLSGSGTKALSLGSIPAAGCLAILIKVDPNTGGQPVYVTVNGASQPIEISPGGGFLYFNPTPVLGVTTISVAYASNCVVRAWALG
jgi:hypothetical protein